VPSYKKGLLGEAVMIGRLYVTHYRGVRCVRVVPNRTSSGSTRFSDTPAALGSSMVLAPD